MTIHINVTQEEEAFFWGCKKIKLMYLSWVVTKDIDTFEWPFGRWLMAYHYWMVEKYREVKGWQVQNTGDNISEL